MKRLLGAALATFSALAFGTTLVPVQLLNPTGSSSGQAIVSTGSSSAPAWGGIGVNGIAAIAANTVLANATSSSASPAAFSMPSCSTSSSALEWITSSGFGCNSAINAAQLAGATWASPPSTGYGSATPEPVAATTITATGTITPSQTAGIVGTTSANNANAGSVGEYMSATNTLASLSSGVNTNITSLSLTAGDWDVTGEEIFTPTASMTSILGGVSTTSATLPAAPLYTQLNIAFTSGSNSSITLPTQRINVSTTTTVYLVGVAVFGSGTTGCTGSIQARRRR